VLHHTPRAKEIVENLKRFLRPNGLFICMLYTQKHFKATGAKTLREYAMLSEGDPRNPYSDYYDTDKARRLFSGFDLLEVFQTYGKKFGWYVFEVQS